MEATTPLTSLLHLRQEAGAGAGVSTCQRAMAAALLRSLMLLPGALLPDADLGAVLNFDSGSCEPHESQSACSRLSTATHMSDSKQWCAHAVLASS